MIVRKIQNLSGFYVDPAGRRFDIESFRNTTAPLAPGEEELRDTTVEDALEAWHLTYDPLPDPEEN